MPTCSVVVATIVGNGRDYTVIELRVPSPSLLPHLALFLHVYTSDGNFFSVQLLVVYRENIAISQTCR